MKIKNKNFAIILLVLLAITIGLYIDRKQSKINQKNFCFSTQDAKDLLDCVERHILSPQDQYDMFYYQAGKFDDPLFNVGFSFALNQCQAYAYQGQCNVRDINVYLTQRINCINSNEYRCLEFAIGEDKISKINERSIKIFNDTVLKLIKLKKYENVCVKEYYLRLDKEEKKKLNNLVIQECEK